MAAAWLSPCTGSSWGSVADLGKAAALFSAISLVGVAVKRRRDGLSHPQARPSCLSKRKDRAPRLSPLRQRLSHTCPAWKWADDGASHSDTLLLTTARSNTILSVPCTVVLMTEYRHARASPRHISLMDDCCSGATLGWVVLDGLRKPAEQAMRDRPLSHHEEPSESDSESDPGLSPCSDFPG